MRASAVCGPSDLEQMLADMPQVSVTHAGYKAKLPREVITIDGLPTRGPVWTHDNDVGNVVQAVHERVLGSIVGGIWTPTMQPEAGAFSGAMLNFRRRLGMHMPSTSLPVSPDEFCANYRGHKRRRYEAAKTSLEAKPVVRADSYPAVFLKAEKWVEVGKAGRLISARHPRYNLALGCYIHHLEPSVYKAIDSVYGSPTIMKGYTPERRAAVVEGHWGSFEDPVAVGQDFSKFDQHISRDALQYEHGVYLAAHAGDAELQRLLSWQLETTCYANVRDGRVKYKVSGGRMSGDMNTAMGNCILSAALLWAYAFEHGIRIRAIVDGDDSVAFMERRDLARYLSGIKEWMAKRGFRLVTEDPVFCINQVEFCQCRYVGTVPSTMVRNPVKAITQDHAWIVDRSLTHREVLAATGLGGLSLYGNIPVLGAYYHMLASSTTLSRRTLRKLSFADSWLRDATIGKGTYAEPSEEARYQFYLAWGISPGEQRALEHDFLAFPMHLLDRFDLVQNHALNIYKSYNTICTNN